MTPQSRDPSDRSAWLQQLEGHLAKAASEGTEATLTSLTEAIISLRKQVLKEEVAVRELGEKTIEAQHRRRRESIRNAFEVGLSGAAAAGGFALIALHPTTVVTLTGAFIAGCGLFSIAREYILRAGPSLRVGSGNQEVGGERGNNSHDS